MRPVRVVASTVAITPAITVASPDRTTLPAANDQRGATTPSPVAHPDSLGLF